MITKIVNGKIISRRGIARNRCLYYGGKEIIAVTDEPRPYDKLIDAGGQYVSPGFIDIHVHGGGGYDFMDGGTQAIVKAADFHLAHGTTSMMPTSLASSRETLTAFLEDLRRVMESHAARGNLLGAHLEGPYFSPRQSGAQNPAYIKNPDPAEYEEILRLYGDVIRRWSFAPELEGSGEFCRRLGENGILSAIAHSDAVYADVEKVYGLGCRLVTHLYSGMSSITRRNGYRRLGVVESAYLLEDMAVEVIADGRHLPPELLKLIVKCKGTEHICLVTDAMRGAGMPEGPSMLGRKGEAMPCIIEDGVAKLPDRTSFAGSVATADRLVRTMVREAGVGLEAAVGMMTAVPARIFRLEKKGILQEGYDADILLFDEDIRVSKVIIGGDLYDEAEHIADQR